MRGFKILRFDFYVGPTYRSNLVNLHKVGNYYCELFHQVSVKFLDVNKARFSIQESSFAMDTCVYIYSRYCVKY